MKTLYVLLTCRLWWKKKKKNWPGCWSSEIRDSLWVCSRAFCHSPSPLRLLLFICMSNVWICVIIFVCFYLLFCCWSFAFVPLFSWWWRIYHRPQPCGGKGLPPSGGKRCYHVIWQHVFNLIYYFVNVDGTAVFIIGTDETSKLDKIMILGITQSLHSFFPREEGLGFILSFLVCLPLILTALMA